MPPKNNGKEKDLTDEDEVLQAVILADSFNKRFRPLTVGKPRCLLPVCNATLLDWTFESLALAGVQEIFVICRSHADKVKAAIHDSKWSKPGSGIKIVPIITAKETFTPGDAMRDIYTHGIITSDFVLVTGDLVSNVRIDEVVRAHKERRKTNKDAIMTMVVKESGAKHRTRSRGENGIFVLDSETSECLHYEPVIGYPPKTFAHIPREILQEHPEVDIRNDLIDCSIDVCSVEVPSLFQDNFDYGDIRRDFVYGVLTSDLLMKNIYCYVLKEGYAARVADTRSYDAVSKDILSRWTFPLVPDNNHPGGHAYEHLRGNKYIAKDNTVVLSRTCKVGPNTLIGSHTQVHDQATIQASVIGQHCTIGANAVLRSAYIFDGTYVGANCIIEDSIIGAGARLGDGAIVRGGCLVGDGVVLGEGAKLHRFERVSRRRVKDVKGDEADDEDEEEEEEEDEELEEIEANQGDVSRIVGPNSNAIVWPQLSADNDEEELNEVEAFNNQRLMRIGDSASDLELSEPGSISSDSDSDSESETGSVASSSFIPLSRTSSATSIGGLSSSLHGLSRRAAQSEFRHEASQSLERAFLEGHSIDNAAVELKTLRMASNVPLREVREAVVSAIVEKVALVDDVAAQRTEIAKVIGRWGGLIDKIGGMDPVETVEVLQYHCATSTRLPLFGQLLAALYQHDIVEEEHIRAWHKKPEAKGAGLKDGPLLEGVKKTWAVGKKMIEQFDEQESSDEDSEDDEEETTKEPVEKEGSDESGEEESEEESEEEAAISPAAAAESPAAVSRPPATPAPNEHLDRDTGRSEGNEEGSEEDGSEGSGSGSEGEESEEEPIPPKSEVVSPVESSVAAVPSVEPKATSAEGSGSKPAQSQAPQSGAARAGDSTIAAPTSASSKDESEDGSGEEEESEEEESEEEESGSGEEESGSGSGSGEEEGSEKDSEASELEDPQAHPQAQAQPSKRASTDS